MQPVLAGASMGAGIAILQASWPAVAADAGVGCELERLDARAPGAARRFTREFRGRRAVLIEGATETWEVLGWGAEDWQRTLQRSTLPLRRSATVAQQGGWHGVTNVSGSDFLASRLAQSGQESLVFTTSRKDALVRELLALGLIETPPLLEKINLFPVVSLGHPEEGLPYHEHEEAWLAIVQGSKQWFLRAPEGKPPGSARVRVDAGTAAKEQGAIRCLQRRGEIVYFPSHWWHATYNTASSGGSSSSGKGSGGITIGLGGLGYAEGAVALAVKGDVGGLERQYGHRELPGRVLQEAASAGHAEVIRWLAGKGLKLGGSKKRGLKSLHLAIRHGHVEAIELLAQHGVRLDAPLAQDGSQPLHAAAASGHTEVISCLLDRGVHVDLPDRGGTTPLGFAAGYGGHLPAAALLLERRATVDEASERGGHQPLHLAASNGHFEAIGLLLEARAALGAALHSGARAEHSAAFGGHVPVLAFLAERRADVVGGRGTRGPSAADAAAQAGHVPVLRWLAGRGAEASLATARASGHRAVLAWLMERARGRAGPGQSEL